MPEDVKVPAPVSTRDLIVQSVADMGVDTGDTDDVSTVPDTSAADAGVTDEADTADTDAVTGAADGVGGVGPAAGRESATGDDADGAPAVAAGSDKPAADGVDPATGKAAVKSDADASADPHVNAALKELGIKAKDKNGKENRIPHSRTVKITENAVKKARTDWEAKELKPLRETSAKQREALDSVRNTETMMFGTTEQKKQFLAQLANAVPGYAELLKGTVATAETGETGAPRQEIASNAPEGPRPKPDAEGGAGYTEEGLEKLLDWTTARAVRLANEARDKDLKPIKDAFETTQQRQARIQSYDTQINEAQQWPGFMENAAAILKAMEDDRMTGAGKIHTIKDAYNTVLYGATKKAVTDEAALETRLREKILAELAASPRSTGAGGGGSGTAAERVVAAQDGPRTTGDIIRDSIRGLK